MRKLFIANFMSVLSVVLFVGVPEVLAFTSLMNDFNNRYGTSGTRLDSCGLCHRNFSTGSTNQFGKDYDRNGGPAIENQDPDNDGFSTITEIRALTMPGYACNALPTGSRVPADLNTYCEPSGSNGAPTANAGPDQTVSLGSSVRLNAGGSTDPDGDSLTYSWEFYEIPPASTAMFSPNSQSLNPTFRVDLPGFYTIQLKVNDGTVDSVLPDFVTISTLNSAPIANAGPDQIGTIGAPVALNGSGSSDADGDSLTYSWSITSQPGAVELFGQNSVMPTFTPDAAGTFEFTLIVNDGKEPSQPDVVRISVGAGNNTPPVANAGDDLMVIVGNGYGLNGLNSRDADGDPLTYRWSLIGKPANSTAVLSDPFSPTPTVNIDLQGTYAIQLIVNDGAADSVPDTITMTTENGGANIPPVADAGQDQTANVNGTVSLDGSNSRDANGDLLIFKWAFSSKPQGSGVSLSNSTSSRPSFVPDQPGVYVVQCMVNDGQVDSVPDTVTIQVQDGPQNGALQIDRARYHKRKRVLWIRGHGVQPGDIVIISDASTGKTVATVKGNRRGSWKKAIRIRRRTSVPCMVQATARGEIDTMVVKNVRSCGSPTIRNVSEDEEDEENEEKKERRRYRRSGRDRHDD